MRTFITIGIGSLALTAAALGGSAASAQSSASTYSYGTYNPVQAAINRNSMNAAIIRQATGKTPPARRYGRPVARRHR